METTRRAAIYCRISKDRRKNTEGEGQGVQRQETECRELAERLGWSVVGVYVDNDVSAYSGAPRKNYARMLADVAAGHVSGIVAWHNDRLHRHPKELETFIDLVEAHHVQIHTVRAGELDLSTASGKMLARMLGSAANYESEQKSERLKSYYRQCAEQGTHRANGARPFGYEQDGTKIRREEARELRKMTDAVIAGESLASIMRDLNSRGVPTTRGGKWGYTSTREMIMRPRNAGIMVRYGKETRKAEWPAIVPEEDFRTACKILLDPARRHNKKGTALKHLLSGMVRCGTCGEKMRPGNVTMPRGKHDYSIYRCPNRGTGHVSREKTPVEQFVTELVLKFLLTPKTRELISPSSPDSPDLIAEREAMVKRLDGYAEMLADDTMTDAQFMTVTKSVRTRIELLDGQITDQTRGSAVKKLLSESDAIKAWESLSLTQKREIIDALMVVHIQPVKRGPRGDAWSGITVQLRGEIRQLFGIPTDAAFTKDMQRVMLSELSDDQEQRIKRAFAA